MVGETRGERRKQRSERRRKKEKAEIAPSVQKLVIACQTERIGGRRFFAAGPDKQSLAQKKDRRERETDSQSVGLVRLNRWRSESQEVEN